MYFTVYTAELCFFICFRRGCQIITNGCNKGLTVRWNSVLHTYAFQSSRVAKCGLMWLRNSIEQKRWILTQNETHSCFLQLPSSSTRLWLLQSTFTFADLATCFARNAFKDLAHFLLVTSYTIHSFYCGGSDAQWRLFKLPSGNQLTSASTGQSHGHVIGRVESAAEA